MMLMRPQPARWFEVIAARDDAYTSLEALAGTAAVEIEWHATAADRRASGAAGTGHLQAQQTYTQLARRCRPYWPAALKHLQAERRAPAEALIGAVGLLQGWQQQAEPLISALQQAAAADSEMQLAAHALAALGDSPIDCSQLAHASGGIKAALFALPADGSIEIASDLLTRSAEVGTERLLLAVGAPASIDALARSVQQAGGRSARFPHWLQPEARSNLALLAQRRADNQAAAAALRAQLASLNDRWAVARTLAEVARANWCLEHGGAIDLGPTDSQGAPSDVFAHITGWTTDRARLLQAVEHSGARAIVAFPAPPRGAHAPLSLVNPWWARPFEVFTRLVGMPAAAGADPSVLLAFAVPLMFGYMFGDVGQGAVLMAVGIALQKRVPLLRLLVPGGAAAIAFGFVFGSVFCLEHVVPALWLSPLSQPLPVLIVPLAAGAILLTLGLLLGLLEAWWQGELALWGRDDAPLLAVYVGLACGLLHAAGWALAALGALWALLAAAQHARHGRRAGAGSLAAALKAGLLAAGRLLERLVQLAINTLSFARVGAFALAHAGLASAVVALAHATQHPVGFVLILVLGNALILAVEGLVVSIQTTRLVLFEFFTRFFRPEGRAFRALAPPPVLLEEK